MGVSDLGINSSLMVAALDLNLVTMITRAMRTVDEQSTAARVPPANVASGTSARVATQNIIPNQFVRNSEKCAATYEPQPVHHWHTRVGDYQPYACTSPATPTDCHSTIQAPWKVLPWPKTVRPVHPSGQRVIKVRCYSADESPVGRTLDLFV